MTTEAERKASFDVIRYAQCWEDADVLIEGLNVEPNDAILSICSAGDNSMALLGAGARRVVAVDMSLPQVMLARLKAAAYLALGREEMLAFLGYVPASAPLRRELFARVAGKLDDAARSYWEKRRPQLDGGIVDEGKFEHYFAIFRRYVLPLVHSRRTVEELVYEKSEAERLRFYRTRWDTWRWRAIFRLFFSRLVMGRLGRDPRFFDYVEGPVSQRIAKRAEHALTVLDPAANPYLQWIVLGRYRTAWPYALRPEHYDAIRSKIAAGALEIYRGSIEEYLNEHPQDRFDGFNLSDIFEYMSEENYAALLERLLAAANPRAALVYWNMLAPRSRPPAFAGRLEPQAEIAARLHREDKAFFYSRLIVETAS